MILTLSALLFCTALTAAPGEEAAPSTYTTTQEKHIVPFFPESAYESLEPLVIGSGFNDIIDTLNSPAIYQDSYGEAFATAITYATCSPEERELLWCAYLARAMAVPTFTTTWHHYPDGHKEQEGGPIGQSIHTMRDLYEQSWKPINLTAALGVSACIGALGGGFTALVTKLSHRQSTLPNDDAAQSSINPLIPGIGVGLLVGGATFGIWKLAHALRPYQNEHIEQIVDNLKQISARFGAYLPPRIHSILQELFGYLRKAPAHSRDKKVLRKRHDVLLSFYRRLKKTVGKAF